ncbi:MAG: amidohydrolase family protein [Chloroflexota bacterium]
MNQPATRVVDIHSHTYPRWYIELLKERTEIPRVSGAEGDERFVIFPEETITGGVGGRPMSDDYWSIDAKLRFMDRNGIDQTVLSLGNPWLEPFTPAASLEAARRINAEFAAFRRQTKGRILGMGALPGGSPADVVTVVEEIAAEPELHGTVSGTHIAGRSLDDAALDPVWAALERTGLPLLIHPHHGSAMNELSGFGHALPVAVGFPLETTVAVTRLVFAGVLHRYPDLKIVASHGGGTIPFLAGRLDAGWRSDAHLVERAPTTPGDVLDKLFLDAVLYHPRALRAAADLVGVGQMAYGTDHPFSISDPAANRAALAEAFDSKEVVQVLAGTAIDLFSVPEPEERAPAS